MDVDNKLSKKIQRALNAAKNGSMYQFRKIIAQIDGEDINHVFRICHVPNIESTSDLWRTLLIRKSFDFADRVSEHPGFNPTMFFLENGELIFGMNVRVILHDTTESLQRILNANVNFYWGEEQDKPSNILAALIVRHGILLQSFIEKKKIPQHVLDWFFQFSCFGRTSWVSVRNLPKLIGNKLLSNAISDHDPAPLLLGNQPLNQKIMQFPACLEDEILLLAVLNIRKDLCFFMEELQKRCSHHLPNEIVTTICRMCFTNHGESMDTFLESCLEAEKAYKRTDCVA